MKVKDKDFKMYIPEGEIAQVVERLAEEVSRDYHDGELVVCPVLTGAFLFAADLVRKLTVPCEVRFVKYTSYSGMSSTGKVTGQLPFPQNVEGRDVLIVEDVVDSGLSMGYMLEELKALRPRSVRVCTLFFKPGAFKGSYKVDYVGREIGDEFIVGYGMDYDEEGRELKDVWKVD
ncbi:MAG: hypoxanthine phosphoribosyltransferase [Bacteroidales bacterium]|nr:hypoxanthine phosphoribosyltransferase [Bacteroidales bacterium]